MKISVALNNIEKSLDKIEKYKKSLEKKVHLFLEKLAETGIDEASVRFKTAQYDGYNDVTVDKPRWINEHCLAISAKGKAVTFIEFGAGVHYSSPPHPKAEEFGFNRGEYGYKLGKLDSWRYEGDPGTNGEIITEGKHAGEIKTHGNPANRAMYESGKKMRSEILKIAKEVFK